MAVRRAEECDLGVVQRGLSSGRLKVFMLTQRGGWRETNIFS